MKNYGATMCSVATINPTGGVWNRRGVGYLEGLKVETVILV
ncbi:hypothetical protein MSL71_50240 [Desulfoluna butyratoxydans]|uniref:Uncharacterized protein n=1 Tax=Desulfoluna butyratoxydans TaxID=231438 RepID=A0A4U8YSG0_9BACT|nr:hypothetical protein MSL71_50240 [Desulfoluna butyratoxydans]